jgi:hypothetical protein
MSFTHTFVQNLFLIVITFIQKKLNPNEIQSYFFLVCICLLNCVSFNFFTFPTTIFTFSHSDATLSQGTDVSKLSPKISYSIPIS